MGIEKIAGRKEEIGLLRKALLSESPEFIAVYGRRRVGKTYLVREFFAAQICFEMVGIHLAPLPDQLNNFAQSLGKAMGYGITPRAPASWQEAFQQLELVIDVKGQKGKPGKQVVFLDEIPWMNSPRSKFLMALEHFWNSYGSKKRNLILVVCGSAASWMIQKIIHSKDGLHNRLTRQIRLLPFNLAETEEFLKTRGVKLTRHDIITLYMSIGGVPFYLNQAEPGLSSAQIIDHLCFSKNGLLRDEFDKLYASLFSGSDQHIKIVEVLKNKSPGLTRNELLILTKFQSGGTLSNILMELEESGFIGASIPWGKKTKDIIYWLSDEFTLFYFNWMKHLGKNNPEPGYWLTRQNSPKRRAWAGYAFERICMKHIPQIKNAMGIGMVETTSGPWKSLTSRDTGISGAQIDLLIDRKDATINICELKYSDSEFEIDAAYAKELRKKTDVFKMVTHTRKNVFITFITTHGITSNPYSRELVSNSFTIECLF